MARITHTRDRASHLRFGGHDGVEFPEGERVIRVDDDQAEWAVETFEDVEYADQEAAEAETVEPEPGTVELDPEPADIEEVGAEDGVEDDNE